MTDSTLHEPEGIASSVEARCGPCEPAGKCRAHHKARSGRLHALRIMPALAAGLMLVLGLLGGSAYAYLSASASGVGQMAVGKLAPVQVEMATVVPGSLFPGGEAGLSLKIKNPNGQAVTLVGVTEVGSTVTVTPTTGSCTAASVSVSSSVASGLSYTLKASTTTGGVTSLVIPTGAAMATSAPSACQDKAFHIKVAVKVRT